MGIIHDVFSSRNGSPNITLENHVGNKGRIFYDENTGELRMSDGITPGGFAIALAIATETTAGSIRPGPEFSVDNEGILTLNYNDSFDIQSDELVLLPATSDQIGGIRLGPGVTLNTQNQLIIDSSGLDFSFGDFSAYTAPGADSTTAAYLSSINANEDIVIASNGTGNVDIIGQFGIFPPNGSIGDRDPVFQVNTDGDVITTTLSVKNSDDLGLQAPLNVTINESGLTKTPTVISGAVAQFTGRDERTPILIIDSYGIDSSRSITGGEFAFRTGRGTNATPVAVQEDDILGSVIAAGWASNGYGGVPSGGVYIKANQNHTATARGGKIELFVTQDDTLDQTTVITVDETGITMGGETEIKNTSAIVFDTTHADDHTTEGTLCWSSSDGTLNLHHGNSVIQQIGQELYAYVLNDTGSTISNGTCVRFAGASNGDGEPRLEVAPFLADGTYPSLYALGVATENIADGETGRITVWGKVRGMNTTGGGEGWQVGDVLYANPSSAGGLTKIKPTAPDNVVPVAAVLKADATEGELFVRPTVEQKMSYGVFTRTTDYSPASSNTAYAIPLNAEEISNGVSLGTPASRLVVDQSGLYQIDITAHFDTTGGTFNEDSFYLWIRKNGVDVANTMRRGGIDGEVPNGLTLSTARILSFDADDYIEVAIAVSNTRVSLAAESATAFGPSTAALEVGVSQIQL